MKNRKIYGFRLRFSLNQLTGGKSQNLGTQIIQAIGFFVPLVVWQSMGFSWDVKGDPS